MDRPHTAFSLSATSQMVWLRWPKTHLPFKLQSSSTLQGPSPTMLVDLPAAGSNSANTCRTTPIWAVVTPASFQAGIRSVRARCTASRHARSLGACRPARRCEPPPPRASAVARLRCSYGLAARERNFCVQGPTWAPPPSDVSLTHPHPAARAPGRTHALANAFFIQAWMLRGTCTSNGTVYICSGQTNIYIIPTCTFEHVQYSSYGT